MLQQYYESAGANLRLVTIVTRRETKMADEEELQLRVAENII